MHPAARQPPLDLPVPPAPARQWNRLYLAIPLVLPAPLLPGVLSDLAGPQVRFYLALLVLLEHQSVLLVPEIPQDRAFPARLVHRRVLLDPVLPVLPADQPVLPVPAVQEYPDKLDRVGFRLNTAGGLNFPGLSQ